MNNPILPPWALYGNPFTNPALTETVLKKIEDGKFVDFTDLLPENQALDIVAGSEGPHFVVQEATSLVKYEDNKKRKAKVSSFHKWSIAWCVFMQAHLHYHPNDFFKLFSYHALIVRYVNEYKYEAVFKYDRDFRLTLAGQKNATIKTVFWDVECDHLRNKYLLNSPLPICDNCKNAGHTKNQCRKANNNNNNTSNATYAHQDPPLHPPQPLFSNAQQNSFRASQNRQQQRFNNNNNNNNNNRGNNNGRNRLPPWQKHCHRFDAGTNCDKPPCMFLHACKNCGDQNHATYQCQTITSTNFIPIS